MLAREATVEIPAQTDDSSFNEDHSTNSNSGQTTFTAQPVAVVDSAAQRRLPSNLRSGLYEGKILHHRLRPAEHRFQYGLYMALIDLDEIELLFGRGLFCSQAKWSPVQFRRSDYLGEPTRPLADCVREVVLNETGRTVAGPIRLLTHLRYFGFTFNPVSFYYCYSLDGRSLEAIVADVTNTPWGERHAYVVPCDEAERAVTHRCDKVFHVSPFMHMDQSYRWKLTAPGEELQVTIESFDDQGKIFIAKLDLHRQPFSKLRLAALLARFPWVTVKVVVTIYWQALRLWLKRVPFVPHPSQQHQRGLR